MSNEVNRFEIQMGEPLPKQVQINRRSPLIQPDPGGANLIVDTGAELGAAGAKVCPCDLSGEILDDGTIVLTIFADPRSTPAVFAILHLQGKWEVRAHGINLQISIDAQ